MGRAALLLHGWPYDIHSYADVAPLLASRGYRALVPFLRGFGTTRFPSSDTMRNGETGGRSHSDVVDLDGCPGIDRAILAGYDWGARSANVVAALWPDLVKADRLGERLPHRQPGGRAGAAPPGSRIQW